MGLKRTFAADMAELADALDSGSSDLLNGRGGSTPLIRIKKPRVFSLMAWL